MNDTQKIEAHTLSSVLPNTYTKAAFALVITYALFLFLPVIVIERTFGLVITGNQLVDWSGVPVLIVGLIAAFSHLHPSTLPFYKLVKYAFIGVFVLSIVMLVSKFIDIASDPLGRQIARSRGVPLGVGAFVLPVSVLLFLVVLIANPIKNVAQGARP